MYSQGWKNSKNDKKFSYKNLLQKNNQKINDNSSHADKRTHLCLHCSKDRNSSSLSRWLPTHSWWIYHNFVDLCNFHWVFLRTSRFCNLPDKARHIDQIQHHNEVLRRNSSNMSSDLSTWRILNNFRGFDSCHWVC